MMRKTIARAALLVILVWAGGACNSDRLTEINVNPNAPTSADGQFLLPNATQNAVQTILTGGQFRSHTGIWTGHLSQIQYPDEETGLVRPSTMENAWTGFYTGPLRDLVMVIRQGVEEDLPNYEAVGRIMKAWVFHHMTDYWGDLPYSEALTHEDSVNTTPVYDTQQSIYTDLLAELTAAAALLEPGGDGFVAGDLIYGNDFAAWRLFANSLRMRLAMRLSEVDAATAEAQFVAAYNAGGFASAADNAWLNYPGPPYENPMHENWLGRDDHAMSATMIDTLLSYNDPRLELFAEPAESDGVYRGQPNGYEQVVDPYTMVDISRIGNYWRENGAATPTLIMGYSEVLFLQAEAAHRGWIAGDPATLYVSAVTAAMNEYPNAPNTPTTGEINAYLAQPEVAYAGGAAGLDQIYLQKWIGLWMNGAEAWSHVRRTNVPYLTPGPDLITTSGEIPVRFSYPDSEQSLNAANLDAAVARQGGLTLEERLWWDAN